MDVSVGFGLGAPCVSFKVLAPPMPLGAGRHLFRLSGGERTAAPCPPRSSCSNKTLSPASRVEECILTELALDVCPAPPPPPPASRPLWSSGWKGCLWPRESAEWAELAGAVMSCQHPPGSRKREGVLVISFSTPYLPSPQGHEDRAGSWVLGLAERTCCVTRQGPRLSLSQRISSLRPIRVSLSASTLPSASSRFVGIMSHI